MKRFLLFSLILFLPFLLFSTAADLATSTLGMYIDFMPSQYSYDFGFYAKSDPQAFTTKLTTFTLTDGAVSETETHRHGEGSLYIYWNVQAPETTLDLKLAAGGTTQNPQMAGEVRNRLDWQIQVSQVESSVVPYVNSTPNTVTIGGLEGDVTYETVTIATLAPATAGENQYSASGAVEIVITTADAYLLQTYRGVLSLTMEAK